MRSRWLLVLLLGGRGYRPAGRLDSWEAKLPSKMPDSHSARQLGSRQSPLAGQVVQFMALQVPATR